MLDSAIVLYALYPVPSLAKHVYGNAYSMRIWILFCVVVFTELEE